MGHDKVGWLGESNQRTKQEQLAETGQCYQVEGRVWAGVRCKRVERQCGGNPLLEDGVQLLG